MNRRKLLSTAPAAVVLAGTAAGVAVTAVAAPMPSPILDAARKIAALNRQHEVADVPGAKATELERIWQRIWSLGHRQLGC